MPSKTEGMWQAEFIYSESNGQRSRENATVTVPTGRALQAGLVLGKVTATGKWAIVDTGASDGSQTAGALLITGFLDNSAGGAPVDFKAAIFARDGEVNQSELLFLKAAGAAMTTPEVTAAIASLAGAGIIVRPAV